MATIDQLEAQAAEIRAAEEAALRALADGMRELAVQLPLGSSLAVDLAAQAKELEGLAGARFSWHPGPSVRCVVRFIVDRYRARLPGGDDVSRLD